MPILKSLSFTQLSKTGSDPNQYRRSRFVEKLEEQKKLLEDPNYIRTTNRWVTVEGQRQIVARQQKVLPWWSTDANGQTVMSVKFGAKPVEFEKGKAGIVVPAKDKLPAIIDTLIGAVRAGELDEVLSQAARNRPVGKSRKAA